MSQLRIAFLSCGSFIHIKPYIDYFKEKGHRVYWITYDRPLWDLGVETFDISSGADANVTATKWKYLLAVPLLRRVLKRIAVDVIHGHYITSAGFLCRLSGFRPYVLTAHGTDMVSSMDSSVKRRILATIIQESSLVNVVSEDLAAMVRRCRAPREKLLLATPGVDTDLFEYRPPERIGKSLRLICTRTLGELYDPWTVVYACRILRSQGVDFSLTFAARGPLQKKLQQYCRQHDLNSSVTFLGGYRNDQLPHLLRGHDISISASKSDGTSISLLETMASGVFPIVSRIAANMAWVQDRQTAYMFDVGNAEQLSERIMQTSLNQDFVRRAVWTNRCCVEERACRKKNMRKLEEAIAHVVAEKPDYAST